MTDRNFCRARNFNLLTIQGTFCVRSSSGSRGARNAASDFCNENLAGRRSIMILLKTVNMQIFPNTIQWCTIIFFTTSHLLERNQRHDRMSSATYRKVLLV